MLINSVCQPTDTADGWIITLLHPVPPIAAGTSASTFQYEITRTGDNPQGNEISNIRICFCPELPDLGIVDCSLTITYVDNENPENLPVIINFPDACEVEDTPPGSECARILLFDNIQSGDQAVGGDYEQQSIIMSFTLNQSLLVGPLDIDFKAGQIEETWTVCGFLCEIPPSDVISDLLESIALEEAALAHIINAEGQKIQAVLGLNPQASLLVEVNESVNNILKTVFKIQALLQFKLEAIQEAQEIINGNNNTD